jgi:hypothetical protein
MSPSGDVPVSFAESVKPLFRESDRSAMSWAFDLWSYDDVSANADEIATQLETGSMPCDGAWPSEQVDVFRRWVADGKQP